MLVTQADWTEWKQVCEAEAYIRARVSTSVEDVSDYTDTLMCDPSIHTIEANASINLQ